MFDLNLADDTDAQARRKRATGIWNPDGTRRSMSGPQMPEEKPPAAVSVIVPDATGQARPYKVQIDPDKLKIGGVTLQTTPLDTATTQPQDSATATAPVAPPPSAVDTAQVNYNRAADELHHAQTDPAAKQPRWKSALQSISLGLANMGPIRTREDLASALSGAVTMGAAGAIKKDLGNQLARPYRVRLAEDRLKVAKDVATTQVGIANIQQDNATAAERLALSQKSQREKEARLTRNHEDITKNRGVQALLNEYGKTQNFDPNDPDQLDDPTSLASRAAAEGLTLGEKNEKQRTRPQFTLGGHRYQMDENGVAQPVVDDKGEILVDPDYDAKIKDRRTRLGISQAMLGIARTREARLAKAQEDKRGDRAAKAEADTEAGKAYESLATEYDAKASKERDPTMQRLYTQKAAEARARSTGLQATSGSLAVDQQMRSFKSDGDFRKYYRQLYNQKHGEDPGSAEEDAAVAKWQAKYGKK